MAGSTLLQHLESAAQKAMQAARCMEPGSLTAGCYLGMCQLLVTVVGCTLQQAAAASAGGSGAGGGGGGGGGGRGNGSGSGSVTETGAALLQPCRPFAHKRHCGRPGAHASASSAAAPGDAADAEALLLQRAAALLQGCATLVLPAALRLCNAAPGQQHVLEGGLAPMLPLLVLALEAGGWAGAWPGRRAGGSNLV